MDSSSTSINDEGLYLTNLEDLQVPVPKLNLNFHAKDLLTAIGRANSEQSTAKEKIPPLAMVKIDKIDF